MVRRWSVRAATALAGLLLLLVCAELALRLVGIWVAHRNPQRVGARGRYVVMCVGDSFTWGVGAPPGGSWPSQLQALLDQQHPGVYTVVNRGFASTNTSQVLEMLGPGMDAFQPHLVIAITGTANLNWNDYKNPRFREGSWLSRLNNLIYRLRVFKLGVLLARDVRCKIAERALEVRKQRQAAGRERTAESCVDLAWAARGDVELIKAWLDEAEQRGNRSPRLLQVYAALVTERRERDRLARYTAFAAEANAAGYEVDRIGLAEAHRMLNEYEAARACYLRLYNSPGSGGQAAEGLAVVCAEQGNLKEALEWLDRARALGCTSAEQRNPTLRALRHPEQGQQRWGTADSWFTCQQEERARLAGAQTQLNERETWVLTDLRTLVARVRGQGAFILMSTYPCEPVNVFIERVARELKVPLVDQEGAFRLLSNRAAYFAPDAHCNALGYGVMARTILPWVVHLLPPP